MKRLAGLALVLILVLAVCLNAAMAAGPNAVLKKQFNGVGVRNNGLKRLLENGIINQEQYDKIMAVEKEIAALRDELKDMDPAERRAKIAEMRETGLKELLENGIISQEQYDKLTARKFKPGNIKAVRGRGPADIGVKNIELYKRLERLGNQEISEALRGLKETMDKRPTLLREIKETKKEILPQLKEARKSGDTETIKGIIQKRIEAIDVESELTQAKLEVRKAKLKIELELLEEEIDVDAVKGELRFIIDKEKEITELLEAKLELYKATIELLQ